MSRRFCYAGALIALLVFGLLAWSFIHTPPPPYQTELLFADVAEYTPPSSAQPLVYLVTLPQHPFLRRIQLLSLRCYAASTGIKYLELDPGDVSFLPFEFARHFIVSQSLNDLEENSVVFVVPEATLAGLSTKSLFDWVKKYRHSDIVFFEEETKESLGRLAASSYMVRNTPFSRSFLKNWGMLYVGQNVWGVTNPLASWKDDTTALHVLLLSQLVPSKAGPCHRAYLDYVSSLDHSGNEYWKIIACTKYALGPPRRWPVNKLDTKIGEITILPRYHAWTIDRTSLIDPVNPFFPFLHFDAPTHDAMTIMDFTESLAGTPCRKVGAFFFPLPDEDVLQGFWLDSEMSLEARMPSMHFQLPLWDFDKKENACLLTLSCKPLGPNDRVLLPMYAPPSKWSYLALEDSFLSRVFLWLNY